MSAPLRVSSVSSRTPFGPAALVAGVAGLAVVLAGFLLGRGTAPAGTVVAGCDPLAAQVQQVQEQRARGRTTVAIALAEVALAQDRYSACEARAGLALLHYRLGVDELLSPPVSSAPGDATGRQLVLRWLEIERKADGFGVPKAEREPALSVARKAYGPGRWPLAEAAFRQAWLGGEVGPGDLSTARLYFAILRNWSGELGALPTAQAREQRVALLATAQAIDDAYGLGQGEACLDLRGLGYEDCRQPAPDPSNPILAAARR